ncbi:MAG: type II toxin-antitoxin system PemK/MazF family toxin [Acidobacteriaceae bacterium]|nr:type II toxin-antitoxin system PemK/MazF family toxin [Acidobacteriaceae bacterium]MBV9034461.1 type II toxin-antitoxin system PemK/MazF family toxin [Acidobacteriaceae bacterium]MBV9223531.1 type II toxin-antitoxin system PemK/MazF family toxin [Acidobacteriaceae bacterium]MBV9305331.1 type II toxin-antitoxin system PemK/MazF family toxin [Acidobacteriaceae bacterium]MBV9939860.1 type II toxin-antitoxin system PemK/MazF family toxin [Acidobacteriaceae bacterium]
MINPHPGEVWLADLGLAAKTRPVVVVSRYDPDAPRALVLYLPLTTQNRSGGIVLRSDLGLDSVSTLSSRARRVAGQCRLS